VHLCASSLQRFAPYLRADRFPCPTAAHRRERSSERVESAYMTSTVGLLVITTVVAASHAVRMQATSSRCIVTRRRTGARANLRDHTTKPTLLTITSTTSRAVSGCWAGGTVGAEGRGGALQGRSTEMHAWGILGSVPISYLFLSK